VPIFPQVFNTTSKECGLGETVETAQRFTVDSVIGDYLRILIARSSKPIETPTKSTLARFDVWGKETEEVLKRDGAARMIGVKPASLLEGRVFVQIRGQTLDISKPVRKRSKKAYAPLLCREFHRRVSRNW
jgi:hypothetical protein